MEFPDINDPLAGPFWRAAAEHRLAMPWCESCDKAIWYPEPACPVCDGELHWSPLNGRARLVAWTAVHKPVNPMFTPPYMPALVVPEEAPEARLVTQLVDCSPRDLCCDKQMIVDFRQLSPRGVEPYTAPVFKPG